ncbi:hypothetical protein MB27_28770 [Actinoplanes utahensis]|uniref:Uncharacterized protein n=1 Tax=Actinoplanes utahensis TaxID=1869 RepID=A0A0A6UEG4_ACTUT|nr:hypothetical protein MB27_28770 [Actinoplanes utahensis]
MAGWATLVAVMTAVATWTALPLLVQWLPVDGPERPPVQQAGTLPARVGAPAIWTPDQEQSPIGAASVYYTSNTWFDDSHLAVGLVGRGTDTYRVGRFTGAAGMTGAISPDGARLAVEDGLVDLATGRLTGYPEPWAGHSVQPQAWSPDGARLAVLVGDHETESDGATGTGDAATGTGDAATGTGDGATGTGDGATGTGDAATGEDDSTAGEQDDGGTGADEAEKAPLTRVRLALLEPANGTIREIARLSDRAALPGWTVAFSPDGSRLAFPSEDRLHVRTLAGGTTIDLPLPADARIAGKGAWTRDGRNLLVVSGARCDCGDHPVRWTVTTISATDGAVTGTEISREGVYALRVIGWWPSGTPVAVEYTAVSGADPSLFTDPAGRDGLTSQIDIEAARLIDLGTGRTLLTDGSTIVPGAIESLDIPDQVLAAGAVRPGDPPLLDHGTVLLIPASIFAVSLVVVIAATVLRLARREDPGGTPPADPISRDSSAPTG